MIALMDGLVSEDGFPSFEIAGRFAPVAGLLPRSMIPFPLTIHAFLGLNHIHPLFLPAQFKSRSRFRVGPSKECRHPVRDVKREEEEILRTHHLD